MLQGVENTDCFCDYSLTFSNVCGKEGNHLVCSVFLSFLPKCVFAIECAFSCVHVWIPQRQDEEMERQLPEES